MVGPRQLFLEKGGQRRDWVQLPWQWQGDSLRYCWRQRARVGRQRQPRRIHQRLRRDRRLHGQRPPRQKSTNRRWPPTCGSAPPRTISGMSTWAWSPRRSLTATPTTPASTAVPDGVGVAALMRSADPELTRRDLKLPLSASARNNDSENFLWKDGRQNSGPPRPPTATNSTTSTGSAWWTRRPPLTWRNGEEAEA